MSKTSTSETRALTLPAELVSLSEQITQEIISALRSREVRRALEVRQGRLVIDWANGHVTYCQTEIRFKAGVDFSLRARCEAADDGGG